MATRPVFSWGFQILTSASDQNHPNHVFFHSRPFSGGEISSFWGSSVPIHGFFLVKAMKNIQRTYLLVVVTCFCKYMCVYIYIYIYTVYIDRCIYIYIYIHILINWLAACSLPMFGHVGMGSDILSKRWCLKSKISPRLV